MRIIWIVMIGFVISMLVSPGIAEEDIRLKTPKDGYFVGTTPIFKWESISDVDHYTLKVCGDEECEEEILEISNIENTEWGSKEEWLDNNPSKLDVEKEYFWKVTARRNHESEMRSFTVGYMFLVEVTDDEGNPLAGVSVQLKSSGNPVSIGTTESDGTAKVYGFGECVLTLNKFDFPTEEKEITLNKNNTESITLSNKGNLIIDVTDEKGNPIEPDNIMLISTENGTENSIDITNSMMEGTYNIRVEKEGFEPKTIENVEITAKKETHIPCILERLKHTITIQVTDSSNKELVQLASIFLDNKFVGNTNNKGELEIPNVEHTTHDILIIKEGYDEKEMNDYSIANSDRIPIKIEPLNESSFPNLLSIGIPIIFSIILLILYIRTNSKLKKVNNRLKSVTEKQKKDLKESKKNINTIEKYVSRILEKT
jgi:hypothetical protein